MIRNTYANTKSSSIERSGRVCFREEAEKPIKGD